MGEVAFLDRHRDKIIDYLEELKVRIRTGEIEGILVCAFPEDLSETETSVLGLTHMDIVEGIGALEVAKASLLNTLASDE